MFKTHRLWYHSTLGSRVIKKKKGGGGVVKAEEEVNHGEY